MSLASLAQVKAYANIPATNTLRDAQFAFLLTGVSDYVESKVNRTFEQQQFVEIYSGDATPNLLLKQWPVLSIQSIYLDNGAYFGQGVNPPYSPFGPSTLLVDGIDYALRTLSSSVGSAIGMVYKIQGSWNAPARRQMGIVSNLPSVGIGNIQVTYTAGYNPIPADIQMAVCGLVVRMANSAQFGGPMAEGSYEDASVSMFDLAKAGTLLGSIENVLAQYDEVAI